MMNQFPSHSAIYLNYQCVSLQSMQRYKLNFPECFLGHCLSRCDVRIGGTALTPLLQVALVAAIRADHYVTISTILYMLW